MLENILRARSSEYRKVVVSTYGPLTPDNDTGKNLSHVFIL